MSRFLLMLLVCLTISCGRSRSTLPIPPKPIPINDVHWVSLVRDFQTADSYTNRVVRVRLEYKEYRVDGLDLKVWFSVRDREPIIIFHLSKPLPVGTKDICLEAKCEGPKKDGNIRNIYGADYCVHCRDAVLVP